MSRVSDTKLLMLSSEAQTIAFGAVLAKAIGEQGAVIYLDGDLGAGKTTLSRGLVRAFGHSGAVKSPTYTLVEPYELSDKSIYHFDLYRLQQPEELYYLGVEDYLQKPAAVCLFEWSIKGLGEIPQADLKLQLDADGCESHQHRKLAITACSDRGRTILRNLADTNAVFE